ncbi:MAG: 2-amino-4-hydroxy-6-hydroxymethyldihydropteridine diphosphokinase [Austwickia sp.]|nr:MAG: 2-amino-4-hydroxy-6-hydroxymethyldihydropteridine diphosphokinase [Austwickia sp.]
MSDIISLRGLAVEACHGVLAPEKTEPQPFLIDIDLAVDLSRAGRSDDLADTVSYADIAGRAAAVVAGPSVDLIETLAQRVAEACLAASELVEAASVTVHKPRAPIEEPFADVAVTRRVARAATAVVGLGANLSDPAGRLADAVRRIAALDGVQAGTLSPLVETDPVGGPPGQPAYLNAVLVVQTRLAPRTLLGRLQDIEALHGRTRDVRWGPRTLDLDLISYVDPRQGGEVRSDDPELTLPHPRAAERAFVQVPWAMADASRPAVALGDGVRRGPDWPAHLAAVVMVAPW